MSRDIKKPFPTTVVAISVIFTTMSAVYYQQDMIGTSIDIYGGLRGTSVPWLFA